MLAKWLKGWGLVELVRSCSLMEPIKLTAVSSQINDQDNRCDGSLVGWAGFQKSHGRHNGRLGMLIAVKGILRFL